MDMLTGEEIKSIREKLNWSSTEMGAYLGVTAAAIWYWETGERHPRWDTMVKINDLREKFNRGEIKAKPDKPANGDSKPGKRRTVSA